MGEILNDPARKIQDEIKTTMWFIRNRLQEYFGYSHINQLKNLNDIFMELRDILHPKTEKEKVPLNWGMINQDIQIEDIAGGLEKLRVKAGKKVKTNLSPYLTKAWRTVLRRLNKYKGKLNPIIELKGEKFVLPRTNNLCETGFRDCKRKARRTTGTKNLSNHIDNLPPQYFYTFNLNDKEYIRTIFGDGEVCDSFHKIDKDAVRAGIEKMKVQRLSPKMIDYKLIRSNSYLDQITEHFTSRSKVTSDLNREDAA